MRRRRAILLRLGIKGGWIINWVLGGCLWFGKWVWTSEMEFLGGKLVSDVG